MDANDLLMDYTLLLGPAGLAEVMLILEEEQRAEPVTRIQVASAIGSVLETDDDSAGQLS